MTIEFNSKAQYDTYIETLSWKNYVLDRNVTYVSNYSGVTTVLLSEFHLPWGVGALLKNKIASSIVSKAKEQGATVMRVRFWSNTAGIFEDKYRVEVTAHDSPLAWLAITAIVIGALALLGIAISLIMLAAAVYKIAAAVAGNLLPLTLIIAGTMAVIYLASGKKTPGKEKLR